MFDLPSKETACGLFGVWHFISSALCIAAVVLLALWLCKKGDGLILTLTRVMAVMLAMLETVKIAFKLLIGEGIYIDHYLPLFYCSLFIYALFMCGFCSGALYKAGASFVSGGALVSGLAFLIFPVTSLPDYPVYHFISLHSMLFHSCMMLMGIIFMSRQYALLNRSAYLHYCVFVSVPIVISLILNPIFDSNLMLISVPTNLPIDFINKIFESAPFVYTLGACAMYLVLPFFVSKGLIAAINSLKSRKTCR